MVDEQVNAKRMVNPAASVMHGEHMLLNDSMTTPAKFVSQEHFVRRLEEAGAEIAMELDC